LSIETAVVFDYDMNPIFWHLPIGRTAGSIPDTRTLWEVLMENRDDVFGIAHSHPGTGYPCPSWTDITTFSACELGLGKKLLWPIISENRLSMFMWNGPDKYSYQEVFVDQELHWIEKLKEYSYGER